MKVTKEDVEKAKYEWQAAYTAAAKAAAEAAAVARAAKAASAEAYAKADAVAEVCDAAWDKYKKLKEEYEL